MLANASASTRKKRIPKLAYTDHRGIGWHVSFRDPATGLSRKHRFGLIPEERAEILYHQWVSEHFDGNSIFGSGPRLARRADNREVREALGQSLRYAGVENY